MTDKRTMELLKEKFGCPQAAYSEIINLEAILRLPKGTEHFLSDLHGEYEAFCHLINSCSGVIRDKIDLLFSKLLSERERRELATTIYYPDLKIAELHASGADMAAWYKTTLYRMTQVARKVARKYTRSKVRKSMKPFYAYIIDEMLHSEMDVEADKTPYYEEIFSEIISLGQADGFVCAIADLIKRLAVDRLHIVGDVFDRGENPDKILDILCEHHSIDFQWGNHDILWMGAAAGSAVCILTVIELCLKYSNLELLEIGYGISLRELALYAARLEYDEKFAPREADKLTEADRTAAAKMRKAVFLMMLKLEGQVIDRHSEYDMQARAVLRHIDCKRARAVTDDGEIALIDAMDFADIDAKRPFALDAEERRVVDFLIKSFTGSEKLCRHLRFLLDKGSIYRICNGNLIFHGCIPLREDGSFMSLRIGGRDLCGKALLDELDGQVRRAACSKCESDKDIFWYLWCGSCSPLFGRKKLATFESVYAADKSLCREEKNAYYVLSRKKEVCEKILLEFGLSGSKSHIVNGHIPVEALRGESPVKAEGKLIVIDGGFCKAYHDRTGIAGYTLICNSYGMRLAAHKPFTGIAEALASNVDIDSVSTIFETNSSRTKVADTDTGVKIKGQIALLKEFLVYEGWSNDDKKVL